MLISKIYLKGVLMWCEWTLTRWVKVASNAGRHTPLFKHRCSHYVCFFHSSEPGWARLSAASSCDTCLITWVLASSPLRLLASNSNDHLNLNSSCRFFAWISFFRVWLFSFFLLYLCLEQSRYHGEWSDCRGKKKQRETKPNGEDCCWCGRGRGVVTRSHNSRINI